MMSPFFFINEHSGKAISRLLAGFHGHLLSDAASIYDVLYREFGIIAVYCWAHVRRAFWKALPTDKDLATQALSLISKLFEIERECAQLPMPTRTRAGADRARPLLELFDANLAMGRDNWRYFINRTSLNWYTTFRSLIASCHLHGINPQTYLEEVLRLAPHWPARQMLRLSPKYWPQTRAALTAQQLDILRSPWQGSAVVDSPSADARARTTAAPLVRAA